MRHLARQRDRLVEVFGFDHEEAAELLLGLRVRPVGEQLMPAVEAQRRGGRRRPQSFAAAHLVGGDQLVGVGAPGRQALAARGFGLIVQAALVSADEQQVLHVASSSVSRLILGHPIDAHQDYERRPPISTVEAALAKINWPLLKSNWSLQ